MLEKKSFKRENLYFWKVLECYSIIKYLCDNYLMTSSILFVIYYCFKSFYYYTLLSSIHMKYI